MSSRLQAECLDAIVFVIGALRITSGTIALELAARAAGAHVRTAQRALKEQLAAGTRVPLVKRVRLRDLRAGVNGTASGRRLLVLTDAGVRHLAKAGIHVTAWRAPSKSLAMYSAVLFILEHLAYGASISLLGRVRPTTIRHGDSHLAVLPIGRNDGRSYWDEEPWSLKLLGGELGLPVLIGGESPFAPRLPKRWMERLSFTREPHVVFHGWRSRGMSLTLCRCAPEQKDPHTIPGLHRTHLHTSLAEWDEDVTYAVRSSFRSWDQWAEALLTLAAYAELPQVVLPPSSRGDGPARWDFRDRVEREYRRLLATGSPVPPPGTNRGRAVGRGPLAELPSLSEAAPPRARAVWPQSPSIESTK